MIHNALCFFPFALLKPQLLNSDGCSRVHLEHLEEKFFFWNTEQRLSRCWKLAHALLCAIWLYFMFPPGSNHTGCNKKCNTVCTNVGQKLLISNIFNIKHLYSIISYYVIFCSVLLYSIPFTHRHKYNGDRLCVKANSVPYPVHKVIQTPITKPWPACTSFWLFYIVFNPQKYSAFRGHIFLFGHYMLHLNFEYKKILTSSVSRNPFLDNLAGHNWSHVQHSVPMHKSFGFHVVIV